MVNRKDRLVQRLLTSDRGNFAIAFNLERFASSRGHTLLELALGWLLAKPRVATVIAAASSPEQVRSNVAAAEA